MKDEFVFYEKQRQKPYIVVAMIIAYNMSGNRGLQLELTDGKRILIGTRKPHEMEDILRKSGKWNG